MSVFGVGPWFVVLSLAYAAVGTSLRVLYPEHTTIPGLPRGAQVAAGVVLLAVGIPFFVAAMRALRRGFPEDRLFTQGVYATCRHPVYGCWVVFNVPGIILLADSWPGLVVTGLMYVTLKLLVVREERYLEERFGDEYRAYAARTPAVLPLLWRLGRK